MNTSATWDLLTQWRFQPLLIGTIILLVVLYVRGWPLYLQRPVEEPVLENSIDTPRQSKPVLFTLSLIVLALALLSPIYALASQFFFMRVAQHLLVISLFPALFMHSNPFPVLIRGLPERYQQKFKAADHPSYQWLRRLTSKGVMWFLFIGCVWLWYDETLHTWTLEYPWLRPFELFTLITAALFHWWHITGAAPRLHKKLPSFAHIGYTAAGAAPLKVPGLLLLFSLHAFYPYPTATFFGLAIDPLLSQQIGGILIWVLGGTVYSTTALRFLSQWFDMEAKKPPQPLSIWDNEDAMMAPGIRD